MARPRKTGTLHVYRIKLRLWEDEDDDLLAFLQTIPAGQRASAIKMALRSGQISLPESQQSVDEDDLADLAAGLLM